MHDNFDQIIDSLCQEIASNLEAMAQTTSLEEKGKYSDIVKNLTASHGVYLDFIGNIKALSMHEDPNFDDFPDFLDDE